MALVELLCKKLADSTFRGRIVVDGAPDPNLHVDHGTCDDLRRIWIAARDKYVSSPSINGDCHECFPHDFLEQEAKPKIDSVRDQSKDENKTPSGNGE
ncbi:MAG: hypothetical protein CME32_27215 [Gimesia sp.]|nr:hypothetical protein [Gimesia sp.]